MPERCADFPASIFEVLGGVDVLLHAGDLGELWVLDRLSTIAPAVAVHGNDDTADAQRELPFQQLVSVAGRRILLWHSHRADPAEDRANRGGAWHPYLARLAARGREVGAGIVVFGHAHIPLTCTRDGVLLVNPGALASGSLFTRQDRQTVAVLSIHDDGTSRVKHVDLAAPDGVLVPDIDWEAGFDAALERVQSPIVDRRLLEDIVALGPLTEGTLAALKEAILPLCHPVWSGERRRITRAELLGAIDRSTGLGLPEKQRILATLSGEA
jgi:putative phosphoesterase